jgi:uncharacterized protein (DUF885 family)
MLVGWGFLCYTCRDGDIDPLCWREWEMEEEKVSEEARFYSRAEAWLYRVLEQSPVAATQLGEHRWDDRLADNRIEALEAQYREALEALSEFEVMNTDGFDLDARIDHTLVVQILKATKQDFEEIQGHVRDPGYYLGQVTGGIFLLIMKAFAPLPERLRSALGRVRETARVLQEGRANLDPAKVPPVWAEVALEQARQAPGLFLGLLPSIADQGAPELAGALKEAGQEAASAIQAYAEFLENDLLPQAGGDFAAGEAVFNTLLAETHLVDYDADELLETGWRLLEETKAQMERVAKEIDPNKSVEAILEEAKNDHPTADGVLRAYEEAMAATRQFVIDHDMVTIPEGESLRVIETPVFMRPLLPFAAYMSPGILEKEQEGLFLVTPVDADMPPEVQEERLRGHYWAKLPVVALHEGYPGHHLQLVWANQCKTLPRRMGSFLSTLFVEGWAFYCEELMEELGYIASPVQRLGRLSAQLWRAARIILDVSLHCKGMTVSEAVDFLVEKAGLERSNALAEVRRYTNSPTQPQSYLMGKLEILKLVDAYKAAHPDMSMKAMHDGILACGSLPPKLMRKQLLGR